MEQLRAENEGKKLDLEQVRYNVEFLKQNGVNAEVPGLYEIKVQK